MLLLLLTIVACISPMLTFTHLFQMKEWRTDRLCEHLRREGVLRLLFGITRPAIVSIFGVLGVLGVLTAWIPSALTALVLTSVLQAALRRQPTPVWTAKALTVLTVAIVLDLVLAMLLPEAYLPLLLLAQPFVLLLAWTLLFPLDTALKRRIIAKAAALRREHPDLAVIGITGSVGKTTTKGLLTHILAERSHLVTPAYVNTEIGVARWLIRELSASNTLRPTLDAQCEVPIAIVEMGAYRKGEVALLFSFAQPTFGIVTFVGTQHKALFGSKTAILEAKGELVQALPQDGHAFLNADSALCAKLEAIAPCPVTTVGTAPGVRMLATDIEETLTGIRFRVGDTAFSVPLHGTHNVTNVLLAIAAAERLGMSRAAIAERLKTFEPLRHTFGVRQEHGVTVLDDTHNASPESVRAAVEWARTQTEEPKVLLSNGLIELGKDREAIHGELGALAREIFDRVVMLERRSAREFARGYEGETEVLSPETPTVQRGSLLVCVGRMPPSAIERLLPR